MELNKKRKLDLETKKKNRNKNQFYPTKGLDAEDLIYEKKIQKIEKMY